MLKNRRPIHPLVPTAALVVASVVTGWSALSSHADASAVARSADREAAAPDGVPIVERVVSGDMVIDWLQEPPADARSSDPGAGDHTDHHHDHEASAGGGAPHAAEADGTPATTYAADAPASAPGVPGQGFTPISTSIRWRPTGYTIRLAGSDGRIEQLRDEFAAVARTASAAAGAPVTLSPSGGGPATPAAGEITVVVGVGPCGPDVSGCGGPSVQSGQIVSGRVWISSSSLGYSSANRLQLAAHELGHTLGLDHHSHDWSDGRQTMYPELAGVPDYRDGDRRGLRYMSGNDDQPAGRITDVRYAAGRLTVKGALSSGTRIRIAVGSTTRDVVGDAGRFVATIPAPAGAHRVCATSLDAAPSFRRNLGCVQAHAVGTPVGRIDVVAGSFKTVRVAGWAIDPQTAAPVDVEIRRNGEMVTRSRADVPRSDVARQHPAYDARHGFDVDVPAVQGTNEICVRILGVGAGGNGELGCRSVVHAVDPVGAFRADVTTRGVTVRGWALDPNTAAPVEVLATVGGPVPAVPGRFRADHHPADVSRSHPNHTGPHGFSQPIVLAPGDHDLCVTVVNVGLGQDRSLGCVPVRIDPLASIGPDVGSATAGGGLLHGTADRLVTTIVGAVSPPRHQ